MNDDLQAAFRRIFETIPEPVFTGEPAENETIDETIEDRLKSPGNER